MRTTASSPSTTLFSWGLQNLQNIGSNLFFAWATFSLATRAQTFQVSDSASSIEINPAIVATPTGAAAIWGSNRLGLTNTSLGKDIYGSLLNNNGPVGPNVLINTNNTLGDQTRPDIKFDPSSGNLIACWEEAGNSITIARLDADLQATKTIVGADTTPGIEKRNPKLVVLDNGNYSLVWEQNDATQTLWQQNFDASDNRIGGATELLSAPSNYQKAPHPFYNDGQASLVYTTAYIQTADMTGSTNIGDMTENGGLAASFNGDINQPLSASSWKSSGPGYVGKMWSSKKSINGVATYGSNNNGYTSFGGYPTNLTYFSGQNSPISGTDGDYSATIAVNVPDIDNVNPKYSSLARNLASFYSWVYNQPETGGSSIFAEIVFYETRSTVLMRNQNSSFTYQNSTLDIASNAGALSTADGIISYWSYNSGESLKNGVKICFTTTVCNSFTPSSGGYYNPDAVVVNKAVFFQWNNITSTEGIFINLNNQPISDQFTVTSGLRNIETTVIRISENQLLSVMYSETGITAKITDFSIIDTSPSSLEYSNTGANLDITITPPSFSLNLSVNLSLSNPSAGRITIGTAGTTTSTYNNQTGLWQASGPKNDVKSLLQSTQFQPFDSETRNLTIRIAASDDISTIEKMIQLRFKPGDLSPTENAAIIAISIAVVAALYCIALSLPVAAIAILLVTLAVRHKSNQIKDASENSTYGNTAELNAHLATNGDTSHTYGTTKLDEEARKFAAKGSPANHPYGTTSLDLEALESVQGNLGYQGLSELDKKKLLNGEKIETGDQAYQGLSKLEKKALVEGSIMTTQNYVNIQTDQSQSTFSG